MKDPFLDEIEPQVIQHKLLEKDIQTACVEWMRKRGYWARKFSSPGNRSVPDYLFAHIDFGMLAVEFKAPGKSSTDRQEDEQEKMRVSGWEVWADVGSGKGGDIEKFKRTVCLREAGIRDKKHTYRRGL